MIAGLEEASEGDIMIGDVRVNDVPPKDRDIAMVFQNYALYPHMNVYDNISFGLRIRELKGFFWQLTHAAEAKRIKQDIDARVREAARMLDIEKYLTRRPKELSGGQRQRVALARAIVRKPKVFLMDEPLSNLDAKLRVQTRYELISLHRKLGITTVYVTHDQVEAMTMGERMAIMRDGVLQQCDKPETVYAEPANKFVAGFIGSPAMNLLNAPVSGGQAKLGGLTLAVPTSAGATITVGIRPEGFTPSSTGFDVLVEVVEELGADAFVYGTPVDSSVKFANVTEEGAQVIVRWDPKNPPKPGQTITVTANPAAVHLFNSTTGERI
jgi:multiple sugar transport system ATP-binding protein